MGTYAATLSINKGVAERKYDPTPTDTGGAKREHLEKVFGAPVIYVSGAYYLVTQGTPAYLVDVTHSEVLDTPHAKRVLATYERTHTKPQAPPVAEQKNPPEEKAVPDKPFDAASKVEAPHEDKAQGFVMPDDESWEGPAFLSDPTKVTGKLGERDLEEEGRVFKSGDGWDMPSSS